MLCVLGAALDAQAQAPAERAIDVGVAVGVVDRGVYLPSAYGPEGLLLASFSQVELEATLKLGWGRLGLRAAFVMTAFTPYGGELLAVYRVPLPVRWLHLAAAVGVEVGPELLSQTGTQWLGALGAVDLGVRFKLGPGELGGWLRGQLKGPTYGLVRPGAGLFVGYTY